MAEKSKFDCISRQQAIEVLTGWETEPLDEDIVRTLENLPSVTPTERTGEWIIHGEPPIYVRECSECGEKWQYAKEWGPVNYCSNCGAKMKG